MRKNNYNHYGARKQTMDYYDLNNIQSDNNMMMKQQNKLMKSKSSEQESDDMDKENCMCLVYLENGRYKNSFEELSFLGRGGFGEAHKVRHKLDSNLYAIKKIRLHLAFN
jgi:hypothetical protein